jgi:hypothetical protein
MQCRGSLTSWETTSFSKTTLLLGGTESYYQIQCVRKVAVHFLKVLEVMTTSVYTGLKPFNFIRKHFLWIFLWDVLTKAVIAIINSLSVRGRSQYTLHVAAPHRKKVHSDFPNALYHLKTYHNNIAKRCWNNSTVELHLSGLIGTASHLDMQKI